MSGFRIIVGMPAEEAAWEPVDLNVIFFVRFWRWYQPSFWCR